jgi:hypothetical protein
VPGERDLDAAPAGLELDAAQRRLARGLPSTLTEAPAGVETKSAVPVAGAARGLSVKRSSAEAAPVPSSTRRRSGS